MKKAVFLDRDGTINYDSKNYIKTIDEFILFPYTPEAIKKLIKSGFELVVITNQSGLARGLFSESTLQQIHHKLLAALAVENGKLLDIRYCPHHPNDNCNCRKPKPKMVLEAAKEHDIDLERSWFIGDSEKDIITGINAGCKTALVLSGIRDITREIADKWPNQPNIISENLLTAAEKITNLEKHK